MHRPEAAVFRRNFLRDWFLADDWKLGSSNGLYLIRLVCYTQTVYAKMWCMLNTSFLLWKLGFWYFLAECICDEALIKTTGIKSQMGFFGSETSYKYCCIFTAGGRVILCDPSWEEETLGSLNTDASRLHLHFSLTDLTAYSCCTSVINLSCEYD